ncbi:hypothetical protein LTR70_001832 [Exophiala xenobiotica]|nr:hypothetical protein LTR70_001832 [Exophiala xenobiotica]
MYNEAYIPLVGAKHPAMMGCNAPDVFPDFWDYFVGVIKEMSETGQTASGEATRLLMERQGFLEETFFSWKLIPVIGDDGTLLGAYGAPEDRTNTVIGERRTLCVQTLTQRLAIATTFKDLWRVTVETLAENDRDVPFALLYCDDSSLRFGSPAIYRSFEVVGCIGLSQSHPLRSQEVDLDADLNGLSAAIHEAVGHMRTVVISADDADVATLLSDVQWKGSGVPSKQFAVVPIAGGSKTPAALVIGINPHRRYNSWYQSFLEMISDVLASSMSKIRLSNELKYRAEIATKATRDFQRTEMRFSRFANRSTVGLAVTDLAGKIIFANEAWYNFTGIDPEAVNSSWSDNVLDEDLPTMKEWWHRVAALKQSVSFTFRTKNAFKSGNMKMPHRTGFAACYADRDDEGGVETIMGLVMDISEQKWIEEQLLRRTREIAESEHRYRSFADLCPLGIVSTDPNGYVQWGNDAWHDFYGFTKGQVFDAQPWLPYIHPDDVQKARDYFTDLQTKRGQLTVQLKLRKKYSIYEGDRALENNAYVLATGIQEYKPDGITIDHIDFWVTDISAQKLAEKVLTDKMEEAIRTRTQQERFIDMISHEIRNPLSAVLHCGEEIVEAVKQSLVNMNNTSNNGLLTIGHVSGPKSTQLMLYNALQAADTIIYCVNHQKQIVDDVLTLSKLDSELLVVSPVPVKLSDVMQSAVKIFESELRMSDISLDMIEHKSVSELGVDWILLDPNRFLQIVINIITNAIKFTRACETRKIKVTTSVHTERPCHFEEIDFVPRRYNPLQRRGSLVQASSDHASSQIYLRVGVSDTGKGLTAREKKLLFNRFAQASPKTHAEYGGSGLGLFISRQISEMLGGEIGVGTSELGGCTFAFYVTTTKVEKPRSNLLRSAAPPLPGRIKSAPMTLDGLADLENKSPRPGKTAGPPVKVRTLVVEDNLINQKVLCKQLRNHGFEVEAANHGKEALMALEKVEEEGARHFDVMLCDIEMPVMGGIQCVTEVRKREASGEFSARIPIIGVTANVRSTQVNAALEAGMDTITTKPYRIGDLIANIDRLCSNLPP